MSPLKTLLALLALFRPDSVVGIRCFCTDKHCKVGVCESPWCVVGIKKEGSVIRTCGNEDAASLRVCRRHLGDWLEVCSCSTNFCNTFHFLRGEIRQDRFLPSLGDFGGEDDSDVREFTVASHRTDSRHLPASVQDSDDFVQFQVVDRRVPKRPIATSSSYLVVVLIIVPLTVGAAAVFLVAINYYCSLC